MIVKEKVKRIFANIGAWGILVVIFLAGFYLGTFIQNEIILLIIQISLIIISICLFLLFILMIMVEVFNKYFNFAKNSREFIIWLREKKDKKELEEGVSK